MNTAGIPKEYQTKKSLVSKSYKKIKSGLQGVKSTAYNTQETSQVLI